jgi:hypothetical protein
MLLLSRYSLTQFNQEVHYYVPKKENQPLDPVLSDFNSVHYFENYSPKIHLILSFHLRLGPTNCLFSQNIPEQFCTRGNQKFSD